MAKCSYLRARVEPELKEDVEGLFAEMGLTPSQAITLFYRQVKLSRSIPFTIKVPEKIPNETTLKAMSEDTKGLPRYKSVKEAFDSIDL